MKQHDNDRLTALLKRWRDIEPRANFETNVWRRIRASRAEQGEGGSWIELIGRLIWQPAWSVAMALAIALAAGIWGGIVSVPHRTDTSKTELQFLAPGTLAGSYLQITAKESR